MFEVFPLTYFKIDNTTNVLVTDFIRAVKLDDSLKNNELFFNIYEVLDNETPEIISYKMYGSTQYHWVIMLLNEKFDAYNDFPKSDNIIYNYSLDKYIDINALHHYEDSNGNIVDQFYPLKTIISNIDYERQLNEEKRSIKILKKEILSEFVSNYKSLISI